jgi:hypothetical protein
VAVVQYPFTHKQYTEQHKEQNNTNNNYFGRVRTVPRVCEFYPGICLTTEGKAGRNLSQGKKNSEYSIHITKIPTHYKTYTKPTHMPTYYKTHAYTHIHTHTHNYKTI